MHRKAAQQRAGYDDGAGQATAELKQAVAVEAQIAGATPAGRQEDINFANDYLPKLRSNLFGEALVRELATRPLDDAIQHIVVESFEERLATGPQAASSCEPLTHAQTRHVQRFYDAMKTQLESTGFTATVQKILDDGVDRENLQQLVAAAFAETVRKRLGSGR
jgi:hypothetical protein